MSPATAVATRGRRTTATREDVLRVARREYLAGRRVDVQAIAAELGVARMTVYRWFGSREDLLGALIVELFVPEIERARRGARGRGPESVLDALARVYRAMSASKAFRRFLEHEQQLALRVLTSSGGVVQPLAVSVTEELIRRAMEDGYVPPVEPATLAFALVRLGEAFVYDDAVAGIRDDGERLREVQAALLGIGGDR